MIEPLPATEHTPDSLKVAFTGNSPKAYAYILDCIYESCRQSRILRLPPIYAYPVYCYALIVQVAVYLGFMGPKSLLRTRINGIAADQVTTYDARVICDNFPSGNILRHLVADDIGNAEVDGRLRNEEDWKAVVYEVEEFNDDLMETLKAVCVANKKEEAARKARSVDSPTMIKGPVLKLRGG